MESTAWRGVGAEVRHWQIGRFRFDAVTRQLEDDRTATSLTVKMAAVLQRLAERQGDVVARDELIRDVWDGNAYTGTRALTQVVWKLRRLLDGETEPADGVGAIRTVSKTGYQLLLPAAPLAAGLPGTAPSTAPSAPPPAPRRRAAIALALGGLVVAVAAGLLVWPQRAPLPTGVDATPPQPLTLLDGVEDYPAFSADASRLAFVWSAQPGAADRVRIVDPQRPDAPPLDLLDEPGYALARPMWLGPGTLAYARSRDGDCDVVAVELASRARRRLAGCYYQRRLAFVDASPDGRWLALARHRPGTPEVAIVLLRVADGQERVLTHPDSGHEDGQISFSRDSRRVAFVRGSVTVGDVYAVDIDSGRETRLTHDQAPIGGLSWLADDSGVVFSSVRDGSFANWLVPAQGGTPTLFSRAEAATNLAAMPGQPNAVAATLQKFSDTIQIAPLAGGPALSSFASSGRNLYAQPCADASRLVFLSTRGSRVGLWTADARGDRLRALPLPPGTPDTAACSPTEARWATAVRPPRAASDSLVIGRLDSDEPPLVLAQQAGINNVNWSLDGRSLIVASDREGGWDLWRFEIATQRFERLTDDNGSFGREVQTAGGRWLYYARSSERGLWRRALVDGRPAGRPQQVSDRLDPEDWGNWDWYDGALWLLQRGAAADDLLRSDESGGNARVVRSFPPRQVRRFRSLAIAAGDRVIVSASGAPQADIVRLDGPR